MRFTFLGTGTSAGVPAIACACAVCTSPDPRDRRLRSGAALTWKDPHGRDRVVLIDATPDLREQALRAGLTRCDAVLFTHNHVDHTFGLDELRRFNVVQHAPVDIYAEDHTLDHLRRVYQHIFDKARNVNDSFVATLIPHRLHAPHHDLGGAGSPLRLFGLRFTPLRLLHGRLPILGFRIEPDDDPAPPAGPSHAPAPGPWLFDAAAGPSTRSTPSLFPLAYCTDVSAIPPATWPHLRGLGTLVLDALRHRHHPTHLTLDQAVRIAEQLEPRRTLFTHIAHDLPHAQTNADLPEGMALAYDGQVLEAPGFHAAV